MASKNITPCKYGTKCYRKNPKHLEEFSHGSDTDKDEEEEEEVQEEKEEEATPEPPKKKARTIADFFQKSSDAQKSEKKPEKITESPKSGNTSGYVRPDSDEDGDDAADIDEESGPSSPLDVKENIKSRYHVDMPEDFYQLWEVAESINAPNPQDAFKKSLGLQLVGPYDILAGKSSKKNSKGKKPNYHLHWRYYYDPPEFMTVVKGDDSSQFHMGYFRDDPKENPVFVASNSAKENGTIAPRGENIFAALIWYIDDLSKKDSSKKGSLKSLKEQLQKAAEKEGLALEQKTKSMKARDKKVNCKTFHGAGMVVPVDANEVGYREVPETTGDLKKMFKKIVDAEEGPDRDAATDPLMELVMLIQFANDECDYGMGLELGLDLFTYGGECFHQNILNLMSVVYALLGRHLYKDIIEAHIKNRQRGAKLSQLD